MPERRYYRCWCRAEWHVDYGKQCPRCGRTTQFLSFTKTKVAPGIEERHDEDGGGITMVTVNQLVPGTFLEGELFFGKLDGPEWDAWLKAHGC